MNNEGSLWFYRALSCLNGVMEAHSGPAGLPFGTVGGLGKLIMVKMLKYLTLYSTY
jgi:hypothetical protein